MKMRELFHSLNLHRFLRNRNASRGQVLILAVVIIFFFFLVATALIDIYHLFEARNWGYRVAQQAAIAGAAGTGSNWVVFQPTVDPLADTPTPGAPGCINPIRIELDEALAYDAAEAMLQQEMGARGFVYPGDYVYEIRVHWQYNGDTETGWPPLDIRLGTTGDWNTDNPAVGVYLTFYVHTFMMSIVGRDTVTVHVFAAAEASQPVQCP